MNTDVVVHYKFGAFQLDPGKNVLTHYGQAVALTPKAFATIKYLVMKKGRVVSVAELSEKVWSQIQISSGTIAQNIYTLRKTLGALSGGQSFIQTVSKRGYRFAAPVEEVIFSSTDHTELINEVTDSPLARQVEVDNHSSDTAQLSPAWTTSLDWTPDLRLAVNDIDGVSATDAHLYGSPYMRSIKTSMLSVKSGKVLFMLTLIMVMFVACLLFVIAETKNQSFQEILISYLKQKSKDP